MEGIESWVAKGAQISDRVKTLIKEAQKVTKEVAKDAA
jgi:ribosomal protein S16